jgi:hypothetical protein
MHWSEFACAVLLKVRMLNKATAVLTAEMNVDLLDKYFIRFILYLH